MLPTFILAFRSWELQQDGLWKPEIIFLVITFKEWMKPFQIETCDFVWLITWMRNWRWNEDDSINSFSVIYLTKYDLPFNWIPPHGIPIIQKISHLIFHWFAVRIRKRKKLRSSERERERERERDVISTFIILAKVLRHEISNICHPASHMSAQRTVKWE